MKSNNRTQLLVAMVGFGAMLSCLSPSEPSTVAIPRQSSAGSFGASAPQRLRFDRWFGAFLSDLCENGAEKDEAGFHLLRPKEDPLWALDNSLQSTRDWSWWHADAKYIAAYSWDIVAEKHPSISFRRFLLANIANYLVIDQGDGFFRIDATFTSSGLDELTDLLGDTASATSFRDWFGISHGPGEEATDMRVVMVSDNIAYQPISVRDVVLGTAPPTVVLATNLSQTEAYDLVALLDADQASPSPPEATPVNRSNSSWTDQGI